MSLFDSINETNRAYCLHHVKRSMFLYKSMNYTVKKWIVRIFLRILWILMDFFHNPYRCGPLRVGMYALHPNNRWNRSPFGQTDMLPNVRDVKLHVYIGLHFIVNIHFFCNNKINVLSEGLQMMTDWRCEIINHEI